MDANITVLLLHETYPLGYAALTPALESAQCLYVSPRSRYELGKAGKVGVLIHYIFAKV